MRRRRSLRKRARSPQPRKMVLGLGRCGAWV
jgi:hypothetical protein